MKSLISETIFTKVPTPRTTLATGDECYSPSEIGVSRQGRVHVRRGSARDDGYPRPVATPIPSSGLRRVRGRFDMRAKRATTADRRRRRAAQLSGARVLRRGNGRCWTRLITGRQPRILEPAGFIINPEPSDVVHPLVAPFRLLRSEERRGAACSSAPSAKYRLNPVDRNVPRRGLSRVLVRDRASPLRGSGISWWDNPGLRG